MFKIFVLTSVIAFCVSPGLGMEMLTEEQYVNCSDTIKQAIHEAVLSLRNDYSFGNFSVNTSIALGTYTPIIHIMTGGAGAISNASTGVVVKSIFSSACLTSGIVCKCFVAYKKMSILQTIYCGLLGSLSAISLNNTYGLISNFINVNSTAVLVTVVLTVALGLFIPGVTPSAVPGILA